MLGKIEGKRRREWQRMKWLGSITDSIDMNLSKVWEITTCHATVQGVAKSQTQLSDCTTTKTLVFQWLRLYSSNAGDLGLIPGWGTRSHIQQLRVCTATKIWHSQINKCINIFKKRSEGNSKYYFVIIFIGVVKIIFTILLIITAWLLWVTNWLIGPPCCQLSPWSWAFLKKIFIYLHWILVVACRIFSCGMQDLVPWPGMEPKPPALEVWSLRHWTNREVLWAITSACIYGFLLLL